VADTSFMYSDYAGMSSGSPSLSGRSSKINPTRIYTLNKVTVTHNTDNKVIWRYFKSYLRWWGTPVKDMLYPAVIAGYTYVWNAEDSTFTVTNDEGNAVVHTNITKISDFSASWGVITSSQFSVKYLSATDEDIAMVSERFETKRPLYKDLIGSFMNQDYLTNGVQHIQFNRLVSHSENTPEPISLDFNYIGDSGLRSILLTATEGLQATNNFPTDLLDTEEDLLAAREARVLQCSKIEGMSYLMIAVFAQRLLSASNKVMIEPWMLWDAFRWYYGGTHASSNTRQIFDLSPRWD